MNQPLHEITEVFWAAALWWLEKHEIDTSIAICMDPEPESKSFADVDPGFRVEIPGSNHHEELQRIVALAPICSTWYNNDPMQAVRVLDELDAFCVRCGGHFLRVSGEWDLNVNKCSACAKQMAITGGYIKHAAA
jgi:hypothetical protein